VAPWPRRDLDKDFEERRKRRGKAAQPMSLWEELADIGEEFVEFLEKEIGIKVGLKSQLAHAKMGLGLVCLSDQSTAPLAHACMGASRLLTTLRHSKG
jgi:hypothetical protein